MMGPVQQLTKKMKLQYNNVNKTIITISLTCPPHLNTIRYQKAKEKAALKRTIEILNKRQQNKEPGVPRYELCLDEEDKLEK